MKIKKKVWFKLICWLLIAGISFYVCAFGFKNITKNDYFFKQNTKQNIITIWHIETFEGGKKARIDYIKSVAKSIEHKQNNLLFMVRKINPENLLSELEIGSPDIISFGYGVGKTILPYLKNFNTTFSVRDDLVSSGMFNNKFYAVPYIVGGYSIFNHSVNSNRFYVGTNDYVHPERIYENIGFKPSKIQTQYDAYKDFIYDETSSLLGTTRDLFRVCNLNDIGRLSSMISPVDSYTDLIQYLGIFNSNISTLNFVSECLNYNNQNKLVDYALFSSLSHKLYYSGIYNNMEDAIFNAEIPNVFYD